MASRLLNMLIHCILGLTIFSVAYGISAFSGTSNALCADQTNERRQPFSLKFASTPAEASPGCITIRNDTARHENLLEYVRAVVSKGDLPAVAAFASACDITDLVGATAGVGRRWTSVNATVFDYWHLGSNTKSITAMILALLIQDGHLSWDSTLGELLPDLNMLPDYVSISVSDLTTHHSGLSDDGLTSLFAQSYQWDAGEGRKRITAATLSQPSTSQRGQFHYANVNYIIAGLLIDRMTGTHAEQILQERLFAPLGINDAGFGPLPEPSGMSTCSPWPHIVLAGSLGGPIPYYGAMKYRDNPPVFNTAGRAHMRGWQYAAYLSAVLRASQGRAVTQLGLSEDSAASLNTAVGVSDAMGCRRTYGGWRRCEEDDSGDFILTHDGSNTKYYAHAVIDPSSNQTYAAFTNRGDDAAMWEMRSLVQWIRDGMYLDHSRRDSGNRHSNTTTTNQLWIEEL